MDIKAKLYSTELEKASGLLHSSSASGKLQMPHLRLWRQLVKQQQTFFLMLRATDFKLFFSKY